MEEEGHHHLDLSSKLEGHLSQDQSRSQLQASSQVQLCKLRRAIFIVDVDKHVVVLLLI